MKSELVVISDEKKRLEHAVVNKDAQTQRLQAQVDQEKAVNDRLLQQREAGESELRQMLNHETDKRMEAVREAAAIKTRSEENENRVRRLEEQIARL